MSGPLEGISVVEIAGLGPGPLAATILADLGADVVRVDRAAEVSSYDPALDIGAVLRRSRRSIALDLKRPEATEVVLGLAERADALIEGFRPGVAERLGIGPDVALARNPSLVYARMTGWGQDGPYAMDPGHDINYLAVSGVLRSIGDDDRPPPPPLNIVADFGGGAMFLVLGVLAGIVDARRRGEGQVVDVSMLEGVSMLSAPFHASDVVPRERGTGHTNGGAHFYNAFETADGEYVAFGAIEPQFYDEMIRGLGLDPADVPQHLDEPSNWPPLKKLVAERVRTRTRAEWCEVFEGREACFTPVLSFAETRQDPHVVARDLFVEVDGVMHAKPAPRFSRSSPAVPAGSTRPGQHSRQLLGELGYSGDEVEALLATGAVASAEAGGE